MLLIKSILMMAMATKAFQVTIKKGVLNFEVISSGTAHKRAGALAGVKYFDRLRGKCKFMQITSIKTFRFFALCPALFSISDFGGPGLYDLAKMAESG